MIIFRVTFFHMGTFLPTETVLPDVRLSRIQDTVNCEMADCYSWRHLILS